MPHNQGTVRLDDLERVGAVALDGHCVQMKGVQGLEDLLPKLVAGRKRLAKSDERRGSVLNVEMGGVMGWSNGESAGQCRVESRADHSCSWFAKVSKGGDLTFSSKLCGGRNICAPC